MHIAECRGLLPELLDSAAAGRITPVMAARIPLVEAARGTKLLVRSRNAGTAVLVMGAAADL